jgi:hypothetical protein
VRVYQPTLLDRLLSAIGMLLYGIWKILRYLTIAALVIGIPVGLYLGLVAFVWWLYGIVAGYFLPASWEGALRHPGFWPFVAAFSLLGGLRILWLLPDLAGTFSLKYSDGSRMRVAIGRKRGGK